MMNAEKLRNLKLRSELFRAIRAFFYDAGYIEVETPVKIHAPAPEEYIESVRAEGDFLRTSPELAMKVLLADGMEKIFQIGVCFRANEFGRKHREEFTMLEFYCRGMAYREQAVFTADFVRRAAEQVLGSTRIEYGGMPVDLGSYEFVTVDEAFRRYAGCTAAEADAADRFDELMVTKIEPQLGRGKLTFLCDYPANRASLAQLSVSDPTVAERWELYIAGIELANAFGELTDAAEQKARFRAALKFRAEAGMHAYPEPVEFFAALERGLPASSGCAMGLDRLAMIFCDADDIGMVRA
ncbi:amino acid--tRNA ligase-related protein [uncultured Victivallis sp.]|uniref:amino acid--tRNA ligase-related protein n=1 Tax=uncultured Victivallis sp. TaxID=354118 RepID=UPI0025F96BC5|nr:amino acid--tRNA ligase-related protein [uncultured Victivallis sp.]